MSLVELASLRIIKAEGIRCLYVIAEHEVLTSNGRLILIVPLFCHAWAIIAFADRPVNPQIILRCRKICLGISRRYRHRVVGTDVHP